MNLIFLIREGRPELVLFFTGWAMDERPFLPLSKGPYDLALVYDYRQIHPPDLPPYPRIHVLAWSAGVSVALSLIDRLSADTWTFINGTGAFCHPDWGIHPRIMTRTISALKASSQTTLEAFYKNMFQGEEGLKRFWQNRPRRDPTEILEELKTLTSLEARREVPKGKVNILVGTRDRIVPPRSQKAFWVKFGFNYQEKNWGHFPFYRFQHLGNLLEKGINEA